MARLVSGPAPIGLTFSGTSAACPRRPRVRGAGRSRAGQLASHCGGWTGSGARNCGAGTSHHGWRREPPALQLPAPIPRRAPRQLRPHRRRGLAVLAGRKPQAIVRAFPRTGSCRPPAGQDRAPLHQGRNPACRRRETGEIRGDLPRLRRGHVRAGDRAQAPRRPLLCPVDHARRGCVPCVLAGFSRQQCPDGRSRRAWPGSRCLTKAPRGQQGNLGIFVYLVTILPGRCIISVETAR